MEPTAMQLLQQGCTFAVLNSRGFKEVTNPENGTPFFTLEQATACAQRMNDSQTRGHYYVADYEEVLADAVEDEQTDFALFIGKKVLGL